MKYFVLHSYRIRINKSHMIVVLDLIALHPLRMVQNIHRSFVVCY